MVLETKKQILNNLKAKEKNHMEMTKYLALNDDKSQMSTLS